MSAPAHAARESGSRHARPPEGRRRRGNGLLAMLTHDRVVQAALAMIAAQLLFRAWATYGAWFQIDDYNFISRMGHEGLGPITASRSYFGHVMPGGMYLSWFNHVVAPWHWALPATELLLMQALADVGFVYLMVTLFGSRPGILTPLALFLFSAIAIEGGIWWAAAINLIPLLIALFFALAHHVTYLRTGRFRHAVAADACIVGGLLFNEKSALIYVAITLFTLCYFARGRGWARVRSAVRGRRGALALYVATGAVHVGVYLAVGRDFNPGNVLGYPTYEVVRNVLVHCYVPGIMGGPYRWLGAFSDPGSLAFPGDGYILAAIVASGLILNELLRHRTRSARALILPAFFLLVDIVLVLVTRASAAGPLISLDYRYQGEMAAVTALALACAVMPIKGAPESSGERSSSELLDHPRRVALVTVAVAVLGVYSSIQYVNHWHQGTLGKQWVQSVTGTLDRSSTDVPLVDAPVPYFVTNGYRFPENLQSRILVGQAHADWTSLETDHINVIDGDGAIVPASVDPTRRGLPGTAPDCGYEVQETGVTIPLDGPLAFGGWWVRIGYLSSGDSPVRITTGDTSFGTSVRSGVHALYFLGADDFDSVTISGLAAGVRLCTDDVTVGRPIPAEVSTG